MLRKVQRTKLGKQIYRRSMKRVLEWDISDFVILCSEKPVTRCFG